MSSHYDQPIKLKPSEAAVAKDLPAHSAHPDTAAATPEELDEDVADVLAVLAVHHLSSLIHHGMSRGAAAPESFDGGAAAAMASSPNATSSGGELWCHVLTCSANPLLPSPADAGGVASPSPPPCQGHPLCAVSKLLLLHRLECKEPNCFLCTTVCEPFQRQPLGAHAAIGGAALPRQKQSKWRDVSPDGMDEGRGSLLPSSLLVHQLQALRL